MARRALGLAEPDLWDVLLGSRDDLLLLGGRKASRRSDLGEARRVVELPAAVVLDAIVLPSPGPDVIAQTTEDRDDDDGGLHEPQQHPGSPDVEGRAAATAVPVAGIRTAAAAAHAAAVAAHTVAAVGRKAVARTAVAVTRTAVDSGGTAMEASTCLRTPAVD
jgi:hypothetical protein